MKIKEFSIIEYGPLPDRGRLNLTDFNLFYGKNESGKTLTIDALIKLLAGKNLEQFESINRVDEKPEGYIIITDENNKDIKIKYKKTIENLIDISSNEFFNLFIIRDSDLSFHKESDFYNNITDHLLGLRINDIKRINDNLRDIGKLTPTGKFRNRGEEKLDERITEARECISMVDIIYEKIDEEHYDELEAEVLNKKDEIENLEKDIKNYEDARKREIYEKGFAAFNILRDNNKKIGDLEVYNEKDKQMWRDTENKLKIHSEEKDEIFSKLHINKEVLVNKINEFKNCELEFRIPYKNHNYYEEDIKPEIITYEIKKGDLAGKAEKSKFYTLIWITFTVLFGIFLLGGIIGSNDFAYILAFLFAGVMAIFIIYNLQYIREKAWLDGFIERIKLKLTKLGLEGGNFKEIVINIQKFEEKYTLAKEELDDLKSSLEKIREKIKNLKNEQLPERIKKLENDEKIINNIKRDSKVDSIQEYDENLNLKVQYEKIIENQKAILKNLFSFINEIDEKNILHWDNEIKKFELYKEKGKGLEYNEDTISSLKEKKIKLEEQLTEKTSMMEQVKKELMEIERKANLIIQYKDDYLHCNTSNDLENIKKRLISFLDENSSRRELILEIIEIFGEIEDKEKEKISKLLSKKSSLPEYFNEITEGIYEDVIFEMDTGKIKVKRKDGELFEVEQLSGGTYDQLYFAIRVALGEQLLKDKTGFFLLDDPFIKADSERLDKQINLLKKLTELGWQILYFTSKTEILDKLREDINNENINYIQLESLLTPKLDEFQI